MTIKKLQAAMMEKPCGAHVNACPIPPKKGKKQRGCQWGHTVIEFADRCDDCAGKFLAALKVGTANVAQRMHHMKERS
jgi:primosomal protein N'